MKRYTVTSTNTPRGPVYQILDRMTGAVIESAYKCERWAERETERMEKDAENRSTGLRTDGKGRKRKD